MNFSLNMGFFFFFNILSIYTYKTKTFETPTDFHVSIIFKKKKRNKTFLNPDFAFPFPEDYLSLSRSYAKGQTGSPNPKSPHLINKMQSLSISSTVSLLFPPKQRSTPSPSSKTKNKIPTISELQTSVRNLLLFHSSLYLQ